MTCALLFLEKDDTGVLDDRISCVAWSQSTGNIDVDDLGSCTGRLIFETKGVVTAVGACTDTGDSNSFTLTITTSGSVGEKEQFAFSVEIGKDGEWATVIVNPMSSKFERT